MAHRGGVHIGRKTGVEVAVQVARSRRVAVAVTVGVGVGTSFCQGIHRQADSIRANPIISRILRVCMRVLYIASQDSPELDLLSSMVRRLWSSLRISCQTFQLRVSLSAGVVRSRWASRSSTPAAGRNAGRGGFDPHPLPPLCIGGSRRNFYPNPCCLP